MAVRKRVYIYFANANVDVEYINRCARIRGVSVTSLLSRLLAVIAKDQLVGGILDDFDNMKQRRPGEHKFKEGP